MKMNSSVMTVIAGLALTTVMPVQAQGLGGVLGGAGGASMGRGGIAGHAAAGGMLDSNMRERVQAARERTEAAARSTTERGREAAASTRAAAEGGVRKTREGAERVGQLPAEASGAATTSAATEKRIVNRSVQADGSSSAGFAADRSGADFGGSQATSASLTRAASAPQAPPSTEPETASN
jgi:hypothetical protein